MQKIFNLSGFLTEKVNPKSARIDTFTTEQIIRLINEEDGTIHLAVNKAIPQIVQAADIVISQRDPSGKYI